MYLAQCSILSSSRSIVNKYKMKKSILSLSGVAVLSSEEQKMVKGGLCQYIYNGEVSHIAYGDLGSVIGKANHYCCSSCGTATWSIK